MVQLNYLQSYVEKEITAAEDSRIGEQSVLIAIRPKWCKEILSGRKTIELRRTKPNLSLPFKCYIYCTRNGSNRLEYDSAHGTVDLTGRVVAEFTCNNIFRYSADSLKYAAARGGDSILAKSCVPMEDILKYLDRRDALYAWEISSLKVYDEPKPLSDYVAGRDCPGGATCRKCPYLKDDECRAAFDTERYSPVFRAPQSWCFAGPAEQICSTGGGV